MTIPHCVKHLVFEVPNFRNSDFCARIIGRADEIGFDAATINTEHGTCFAHDIRNNDRVIFDDPNLAKELWNKEQSLFSNSF